MTCAATRPWPLWSGLLLCQRWSDGQSGYFNPRRRTLSTPAECVDSRLGYWNIGSIYVYIYLYLSKYLSKCLSIYIISVVYLYVSIAIYINLYQSISIYIYLYIHNMSPYGYPHGPYSFPWPIGRADLIHGSSSTSWMHLTYRAEQTSRDKGYHENNLTYPRKMKSEPFRTYKS